jgi:hypothetical protein
MSPGIYLPDATEGIINVEDLPKPQIVQRSRNYPSQRCPLCDRSASRLRTCQRTLHELGDPIHNRPRDLHLTYSQHYCKPCDHYFNADMLDLAVPNGHYTHRVVAAAVRCVVEDGLPYRTASWHLWRDHRVFVPFATIQNWAEAAGEKKPQAGRARVSRRRVGQVLRVHRY